MLAEPAAQKLLLVGETPVILTVTGYSSDAKNMDRVPSAR
jgi:hypothetical protein